MRQQSSGRFEVALPAVAAIDLFTPEGERAWVPGWNPQYGTEMPSEAPGSVFTTEVDGVSTIWVIIDIDRKAAIAAYARVTPGGHAGTVRVECVDNAHGGCTTTVAYDITPLDDGADTEAYSDAGFATMMTDWAAAIAGFLEGQPD